MIIALDVTLGICSCVTRTTQISGSTRLVLGGPLHLQTLVVHGMWCHCCFSSPPSPTFGMRIDRFDDFGHKRGFHLVVLWALPRLVAINVNTICHLASEYYCFLRLAAWTAMLHFADARCRLLVLYAHDKVCTSFYTLWRRVESFNEYYFYFIECCCYYSQRLTTLQFFWWHCSEQSTARIADPCIGRRCCCCSWQSTIDPHGLLLWSDTLNMILHHGSLATHLWKTKPFDGTVTLLASISLTSAFAACLVNCCCVAAYTE
jgi:hypothetical protein